MIDWINNHAGLVTLGFVVIFLVILAFQKTNGGPV